MRTIFAEYNSHRNSIDVYTNAVYILRIDCWEAEKDLKTNLSDLQTETHAKIFPKPVFCLPIRL